MGCADKRSCSASAFTVPSPILNHVVCRSEWQASSVFWNAAVGAQRFFVFHGFALGRPEFVDISILYAVLNFLGTLAILRFYRNSDVSDEDL